MKQTTLNKLGRRTERQALIEMEMTFSFGYSAAQAQKDLDRLADKEYIIDGNCRHGYFVKHIDGNVIAKNYSPRELTILTIDLFRNCAE